MNYLQGFKTGKLEKIIVGNRNKQITNILSPFVLSYFYLIFTKFEWNLKEILIFGGSRIEVLLPIVIGAFVLPYLIGLPIYSLKLVLIKKAKNIALPENLSNMMRCIYFSLLLVEFLLGFLFAKASIIIIFEQFPIFKIWSKQLFYTLFISA